MFSKILIANRGEIACRVIRSAKRMGLKTVAVYSEADHDALHVEMADEAVFLGPPPAAQSYLLMDKVIDAVRQTGAEAVHPGFGFLSENAAFAKALKDAGITFIGPNPDAIGAMGDKIESKKLAAAAGVSTVPGYLGVIGDTDEAVRIANEIGYPVMIKASAGGGGKGMRIAYSADEVAEGFTSSMNEARSSFGDDRVFIEKFVTQPRHIEIQVLGDKHGHVIHLNERECSIQRRNQKVIEEAPSPFLDQETRERMGAQAVALAKAVDYDSAGTVEFIVDGQRNFYFLEMNTRLQVEHPVTELITGIDLVEQMIRVAAGERLSIRQEDVKITGWAMESRIYAEDPFRNFLPSIGRLVRYSPPHEGTHAGLTIRNDTGVEEGDEISMFYDPMIAKLCTHGPDRLTAIDHMSMAIDEFFIDGIGHNVPFIAAVMQHPRFREGRLTTGFIAEEYPDGFAGGELHAAAFEAFVATSALINARFVDRERNISGRLGGPVPSVDGDWVITMGGHRLAIHTSSADGSVRTIVGPGSIIPEGTELLLHSDWVPGQPILRGRLTGPIGGMRPMAVQVRPRIDRWELSHSGATVMSVIERPREAALHELMPEKLPPDTSKFLLCPMPGLVVSIEVQEGQEVKAGEPLAVVEAMKMENVLRAERDAVIHKINAKPGDSLAVDEVILEFAAANAA
ncbi:MAG: acetyl-CoA carboxylase biotin carboxylase subunit [Alphaproteobacteria bacterium]